MSNDSNKAAFVHVPLILLVSSLVVSAAESKTVDDGGIWVLVRADNVTGWVNQKHLK